MMTRADIETKVITIVSDQMGLGDVTIGTHLANDLGADSLDAIELTMEFEDVFRITIPDADVESLYTVGDCADYIQQRLVTA